MGALGLCLVLLTLGADPSEDLEGAAPKAAEEEQFVLNFGAKLEALYGTELIGSVDQYSVTSNFVLEPAILVQQRSHTGQVTIVYVPWLLYTPAVPDQKLLFNRVLVEVEQQLSRTVGIYLVARLWVGDQTFSPVVNLGTAPGTGPGGGVGQGPPSTTTIPLVPQSATLNLIDTSARLGVYVLTSAVFRLDLDVGYLYSEGLNELARQELPLQRGPFLDVVGTLKLQTHDALLTTLRSGLLVYGPVYRPGGSNNENGSTVLLPHYNTGLSIWGTEAGLKWQHSLDATLSMELGGGLGVVYQSSSYDIPSLVDEDLLWLHRTPVPATTTVYPIFGASIRDQVPLVNQTLLLSATLAVLPIVDQFSGNVIQRLDLSASALWGVGNNWLFEASAGAAASANPREIDARAELRAVFQASPHVILAGGARIAYLNYAVPGALNGTSWVLFLSVAGASGKLGTVAGASTSQGDLGFLQ